MTAEVKMRNFRVSGNRVTCSDGRWWELQANPLECEEVGSVNDGAGKRRRVPAIGGGPNLPERHVHFDMPPDIVLAWIMAQ